MNNNIQEAKPTCYSCGCSWKQLLIFIPLNSYISDTWLLPAIPHLPSLITSLARGPSSTFYLLTLISDIHLRETLKLSCNSFATAKFTAQITNSIPKLTWAREPEGRVHVNGQLFHKEWINWRAKREQTTLNQERKTVEYGRELCELGHSWNLLHA